MPLHTPEGYYPAYALSRPACCPVCLSSARYQRADHAWLALPELLSLAADGPGTSTANLYGSARGVSAMQIVPHTISFLRLFSPTWSNLAAAVLSTDSPEAWHLLLTSSDALATGVKTLEGPAQLVALEGDSAIDVLR